MSITEAVQSSRNEAAVLASLMSDLSSFPHQRLCPGPLRKQRHSLHNCRYTVGCADFIAKLVTSGTEVVVAVDCQDFGNDVDSNNTSVTHTLFSFHSTLMIKGK